MACERVALSNDRCVAETGPLGDVPVGSARCQRVWCSVTAFAIRLGASCGRSASLCEPAIIRGCRCSELRQFSPVVTHLEGRSAP